MEKFALVCGCNYNGSWKVYQSYNDAKKIEKLLKDTYDFKNDNIHTLFNNQFTKNNIIKQLNWLVSKLKNKDTIGIIYVAGHGTQISDHNKDELDRRDECWSVKIYY